MERSAKAPPSQLSNDQVQTQWITDLDYNGPEGHFGMNLVFRVADATHFSVLAKDKLGRSWWALAVQGGEALALDLRNDTYCRYSGSVQIDAIPLGPLEFDLIPQFILGHLPFEPKRSTSEEDGEWSFQDERDRTWFARLDPDGGLSSWRLVGEAAVPKLWWSRAGRTQVFSAPDQSLQLRWKNSSLRPLQKEPRGLSAPATAQRNCATSSFLSP